MKTDKFEDLLADYASMNHNAGTDSEWGTRPDYAGIETRRKQLVQAFTELEKQRDELLGALIPFAHLVQVMDEGVLLNYKGVYVSWEQARSASTAVEKATVKEGE